jgi:plastocyanin
VKRLVVLFVLVVLVVAPASAALGRNSRSHETAACVKGAVAARIGGKTVCLRAGKACKAKYNSIYKKHGLTCTGGHLRKTKPDTPPPYSPPTGPVGSANTTVAVGAFDASNGQGWFVLSQESIPSGMVTFVITNNCFGSCSFDLVGVKAGAILTTRGQSETWTVALAPGVYRYHCDVDPGGMKGSFTVTP